MLLDSALADLAQEWFANGPQAIVERDNVALVRLAESANPEVLSTYGGLVESTSARDLWRVSYDSREALSGALVGFGQSEQIVWAEAEGRESVSVIPNDTFFFVEYGLHNTGQQYASGLFGTNDADIDAPEAWDRRTSALSVVTANIDTGVNYTHPDLYKNIWINQGEIPASRKANLTDVDADGIITFWDLNDPINIGTNKISDFNGNARIDAGDLLEPLVIENGVDAGGGWANGVSDEVGGDSFTDDIIGWDFFNNDNNPMDDHGHGTHTSGTTAAIGNNGEGVAGVAWKAQIMVLKRFGSSGSSATSFGTLSVAYSVLKGAQVSNNSWGGSGFSQGLYDAVEDARDAGQIFIASAGNNASDIDITPAYPAAFDLANVVSVAATTANDGLASFSNYGDVTVDLGAPGDVIGSTYHDLNNPYVYMSGTSMAGPHVAGAAALVKAQRPSWGYAEIKAHLLSTVDPLASLAGKTVTGGRLNLQKALANVAPTDVALSNSSVAENQPVNTTVGTLSTTDPDLGDTFTYSLVSGTGDTDNASFNIASGVLRTSASFNFEVKSSYTVRVRTTDQGGLFFEKAFTINVTNVNESPTDIQLSAASVAENEPSGTAIGSLSTIDPDAGDTFTYSLVGGAGSDDNASFTIDGGVLKTAASFDFETKSSYSIRVRSQDAGGLSTEKVFAVSVTNVNESPTDIDLSPSSVPENEPSGTSVGAFTTYDPDAGDSFTYALVSGSGDEDNASFTIDVNILKTAASFNFEAKSSYSIRVRSMDAGGFTTEKSFTVNVTDVGESTPPTLGGITGAVAVTYKENAVPLLISSLATVTDPDSPNYGGGVLSVWVSSNATADDRLSIKHTGDGAGKIGVDYGTQTIRYGGVAIATYSGGAGASTFVITFNGAATTAAVQATLKAITFAVASDSPSALARTVSFQLADNGGGVSAVASRTVNVTPVNDKPVVTVTNTSVNYTEGGSPVIIDAGVTVFDVDSADLDLGKLIVKSTGGSTTDRLGIESSGLISVAGTTVNYNGVALGTFAGTTTFTVTLNSTATWDKVQELARHIVFSSLSDAPTTATRQISFTVSDGDGGTNPAAIGDTATITSTNDAPVLTLTNTVAAKYTENAVPVLISSAATVVDVDLLPFDTGELTVAITGNAEATDLLSVKNVGLGANQVSVVGNTINFTNASLVLYAVATFTGGDGANPLVITFNANALKTEVQAVMKAITFASSSENPSTAQRTVSFTLTDGDGGTSNTVVRSVDVTRKNDAPVIANFGPDLDYTIGDPAILVADSATISDIDSPTDFNGGKLTVALGAGKNTADRIKILEGNGITVAGNVVSYNGDAIGTFTGTTTLIVTFNSALVTPEVAQALLRQITFETPTVGLSTTRALTATLTDGDGGTSAIVSKVITVHPLIA